jgi:hypothetical protein
MTSVERLALRASEAVAECLVRQLMVPCVYFEAPWPTEDSHVDVLAVDRAGSGDVHVVEVKRSLKDLRSAARQVMHCPAQFRWLTVSADIWGKTVIASSSGKAPSLLYPPDGMGRIGVIRVVKTPKDGLRAEVLFKAERFKGNLYAQADKFVAGHRPDIDFR